MGFQGDPCPQSYPPPPPGSAHLAPPPPPPCPRSPWYTVPPGSCQDSARPANTRHWTNVELMLGQRRRRWANIRPTLDQCLGFAALSSAALDFTVKLRPLPCRHGNAPTFAININKFSGCWAYCSQGIVYLCKDRQIGMCPALKWLWRCKESCTPPCKTGEIIIFVYRRTPKRKNKKAFYHSEHYSISTLYGFNLYNAEVFLFKAWRQKGFFNLKSS